MNNRIVIKYDGNVTTTKHSLALGEYSLAEIVHKALGFDDEYVDINAEVEISIVHKPAAPRLYVNGDSCELGGGDEC